MCTIVRCVVEENVGIIGGELGRGKIVFGIGLRNKLEYGVALCCCTSCEPLNLSLPCLISVPLLIFLVHSCRSLLILVCVFLVGDDEQPCSLCFSTECLFDGDYPHFNPVYLETGTFVVGFHIVSRSFKGSVCHSREDIFE